MKVVMKSFAQASSQLVCLSPLLARMRQIARTNNYLARQRTIYGEGPAALTDATMSCKLLDVIVGKFLLLPARITGTLKKITILQFSLYKFTFLVSFRGYSSVVERPPCKRETAVRFCLAP